jgi:hypothetical protein
VGRGDENDRAVGGCPGVQFEAKALRALDAAELQAVAAPAGQAAGTARAAAGGPEAPAAGPDDGAALGRSITAEITAALDSATAVRARPWRPRADRVSPERIRYTCIYSPPVKLPASSPSFCASGQGASRPPLSPRAGGAGRG